MIGQTSIDFRPSWAPPKVVSAAISFTPLPKEEPAQRKRRHASIESEDGKHQIMTHAAATKLFKLDRPQDLLDLIGYHGWKIVWISGSGRVVIPKEYISSRERSGRGRRPKD